MTPKTIPQFFAQSSSSTMSSPPAPTTSHLPTPCGDGFTSEEINAVLYPTINESWMPDRDYFEYDIADLYPGPLCVTFMGRVVNISEQINLSKMPQAAKGCLKVVVKDDSGIILIRLWYAKINYQLRLGQLVTIWTPHISTDSQSTLTPSNVTLFTSIFPERDRSCHMMVHKNSDNGTQFRKPLNRNSSQPLLGVMTLQNLLNGGHEVNDAKVIVCVKSIGPLRTYTGKKGSSVFVSVALLDDTAEASLSLWGRLADSVACWEAGKTVLLLTRPGLKAEGKNWLSLKSDSTVEVDPECQDAEWLKKFVTQSFSKQAVNPAFPEGVFDINAAENSSVRILFTLADIDEFVRAAPTEKFTGYMSLIILELNLSTLQRRRRLMSADCCGNAVYGNSNSGRCRQCEKTLTLRLNPYLIGTLIDESGSIANGKLIFSERAWQELFGSNAEQLVSLSVDDLAALEHRLLFLRITLGFGWIGENSPESESPASGRLCVWAVKM